MESWYWWMLLGMALVTYIPRAFPLTFLEGRELPPVVSGVLRNIPYAVLGALIFPAILFVQEGNLLFGLIGTIAAFAIAFAGANVIIVVMGTIAVLAVYSLFVG
ncbi:AzlD domain-containing protein [Paenisporosarcina indica]|uniref:AzlD domain-containing protein n=1 Tax=Paenisporosarcina indica TaxID=650093 RepID=UPI00094F7559|nr:AzlD domain-containing protein [Paenisporosarcina indica]